MYYYRQLVLIYACLVVFFVHLSASSSHAGHLKSFGSSGPFEKLQQLTDEFPDPIEFFDQYLSKSRPLLFRGALITDPHLSLWNTDDKLRDLFVTNKEIVHIETRKKESRKQDILSMTMTEFLRRYQKEELYLVEEVPNLLRPYFILPKCLQCQPALETFQVAMLWFSSGNTSSVVHTDDYDNINCVLQGDKQFILVDPHTYKDVASEIIDNDSGSFSSIDVDRVDYDKYPSLDNNIHYYQVNLSAGDCLFLPALWIHQVRSTNRNIAVNYWLNHARVTKAIVTEKTCSLTEKSNFLTLETIQWPKEINDIEYLQDFMLDLIQDGTTSFKDWTGEFSKEVDFDLRSNIRTMTLFAEFFNMIDTNANGRLTLKEIETLFDDNDNMTIAYEILQDIFDIAEDKLGKQTQSNEPSIDDEVFDDNSSLDGTLSGDEMEEEDDDENLKHVDL